MGLYVDEWMNEWMDYIYVWIVEGDRDAERIQLE